MQFDSLCKEVERRFPEHRPMLEEARLFVLGENDRPRPHGAKGLLRDWSPEEQVVENFRLPFGTVAIDSGNCCVVMKELSADTRKYQVVGATVRARSNVFFNATITAYPGDHVWDGGRLGRIVSCRDMDVFDDGRPVDFSMNEISLQDGNHRQFAATSGAIMEEKDDGFYPREPGVRYRLNGEPVDIMDPRLLQWAKKNVEELEWCLDGTLAQLAFLSVNIAVLCATVICEPARFVVEQSEIGQKPPKGKLIRRSAYRPKYIAMTPGEIKKRFLYDEHEAGEIPRAPHERRGHFRKLTSERYVAKRNHIIWVKPCWIGKTEGVRGKNRYVVKLDL
jgi:hypothetical protein